MRTTTGMPNFLKILMILVLCTFSASIGRLSADRLRHASDIPNQKESQEIDREQWPWNRLPPIAVDEYQRASKLCQISTPPPQLSSDEVLESDDTRLSSAAYLMMAHNEDTVAGLFELLNRIYHPWDIFIIHIDSKADPTYFATLQTHYSHCENVVFVKPRRSNRWGGWGLVATELAMMQTAIAQGRQPPGVKEWEYGFLIDGSSWPRMNRTERLRYIANPKTPDFISTGHPACEFDKPPGEDCSRTPARCLNEECTEMSHTPQQGVLWKSSQWAVINRPLMEWLLVDDASQAWQTFLSANWIPDEFFLCSATRVSPFKESKENTPPHIAASMAVSWSKPNCPSYQDPDSAWKPGSPCYHGNGSYPWLAQQIEPFSRKWYAGDIAKREYLHIDLDAVKLLSAPS